MAPLAGLCLAFVGILGALAPLVVAGPYLEITTDTVTQCHDVPFKYGGGNPPYKFNAVTAYLPTQTQLLSEVSGEGNWRCVFPPKIAPKSQMEVTFFIEDANGEFSYASRLFRINADSGECSFKPSTFEWGWSERGGGDPGVRVAQCKPLTFTTAIESNEKENRTIHLPINVWGVVPGGDVWKTQGGPGATDLTMRLSVAKGNQVVFLVRDAQNNEGGSSNILESIDGTECGSLYMAAGSKKKSLSGGAIAGIVVGAIAGLAIIGACIWFFWWRRRRSSNKDNRRLSEPRVVDMTPRNILGDDNLEPVPFLTPSTDAHASHSLKPGSPGGFTSGPSLSGFSTSDPTDGARTSFMSETTTTVGSVTNPHQRFLKGDKRFTQSSIGSGLAFNSGSSAMPGRSMSDATGSVVHDMDPMYRLQEDAGPMPVSPLSPVIDMPPTYNPDWQASAPAQPSGSALPTESVPPTASAEPVPVEASSGPSAAALEAARPEKSRHQ